MDRFFSCPPAPHAEILRQSEANRQIEEANWIGKQEVLGRERLEAIERTDTAERAHREAIRRQSGQTDSGCP